MTEAQRLENFNIEKISVSKEEIDQAKKRDTIIINLQQDYEKTLKVYQENFNSIKEQYQKLLLDKDKQITAQQEEIDYLRDKIEMLNEQFLDLLVPNLGNQNNQKSEN